MKYIEPSAGKEAFTCPFCGAIAQMVWASIDINLCNVGDEVASGQCMHCKHWTLWHDNKMVYPNRGYAALPNPDMPESVKREYEEAATISALSPKGAAALLRLAVQKLCKELGEKGENINDDIASLVQKGLSPKVQQALDILRVIGNNAVHPGQIDADDPAVVGSLFELVNIIVEKMISDPKKISAIYATLPPTSLQAIQKRTNK